MGVQEKFVALEKASGDPERKEKFDKAYDKLVDRLENGDQVNSPRHYTASKIEVIDILDSVLSSQPELTPYTGFLLGNVVKYLSRFTLKENPLQDVKKAEWYLQKLIAEMQKGEQNG